MRLNAIDPMGSCTDRWYCWPGGGQINPLVKRTRQTIVSAEILFRLPGLLPVRTPGIGWRPGFICHFYMPYLDAFSLEVVKHSQVFAYGSGIIAQLMAVLHVDMACSFALNIGGIEWL